ncbi:hypothetical protein NliqN6_0517 [Naganishia liquefaciens]|uniref:amidase n=1 Tax=Naganishia liquefaciens TaxID=104408 RepID=A0A8H3YCB1_9TREE|nr:hypothetical protein NliqN6_0517 [Naganishia liquefaciens]
MTDTWTARVDAINARTLARIPANVRINGENLPSRIIDLPRTSDLLSPLDRRIIHLDAIDLRDEIARGGLTCVQVAEAFIKSTALAHQGTHCLTDFFPEEALERARWLDEKFKETGEPVGPLHGVPISVKDQIDIQGKDSAAGFLSQGKSMIRFSEPILTPSSVGKNIASEDAHVISILRKAGAIFYCKTTLPQAIMHLETDSYLGPTTNPYQRHAISSGGSSGGEGALLAMRGSPLGIGTDIGGSIRSPASACGLYGFKPTAGILPLIGFRNHGCILGVDRIPPTQGPMGHSIRDLELYMQVVLAANPAVREPNLFPYRWPSQPLPKPSVLRVGYCLDDGVCRPTAPVIRGVQAALTALRQCEGIELVEFTPREPEESWDVARSLYFCDAGQRMKAQCVASGEPVLPLTQWIVDQAGSEPVTLQQYSSLMTRRSELRNRVAAQWAAAGIDVLLCPAGPSVAPKLNTARYWNYTSYWNVVNYPAIIMPTGLYVDSNKDTAKLEDYRNDQERDNASSFDLQLSEGLPICMQLVGRIWQDADLLSTAKVVDEALQKLSQRS